VFSNLGLPAKLPVSDADRQWVDGGFRCLEKLVGRRRMLEAKVTLHTAEDFPDPYNETPAPAEMLFSRVCAYMKIDRNSVEMEIFADETDQLSEILPYWRDDRGRHAAGICMHHAIGKTPQQGAREKCRIAIRSTQLKDPLFLVATVAHELDHIILLGGGLLDWLMKQNPQLGGAIAGSSG